MQTDTRRFAPKMFMSMTCICDEDAPLPLQTFASLLLPSRMLPIPVVGLFLNSKRYITYVYSSKFAVLIIVNLRLLRSYFCFRHNRPHFSAWLERPDVERGKESCTRDATWDFCSLISSSAIQSGHLQTLIWGRFCLKIRNAKVV